MLSWLSSAGQRGSGQHIYLVDRRGILCAETSKVGVPSTASTEHDALPWLEVQSPSKVLDQ